MANNAPSSVSWTAEKLSSLPVAQRLDLCPYFLQAAVKQAIHDLHVTRVWIIGSRARQDASRLSDYDIVFDVPAQYTVHWAMFVSVQREIARTLLPIDWILLSSVREPIRKKTMEEGIVIYERLDEKT